MKLSDRSCTAVATALAFRPGRCAGPRAAPPLRIGSTLALTGPLSTTALTHKLVGEIYVEQLNSAAAGWAARWSGSSRTTSPSRTWPARCTSSW